jgi:cytochrome c biogenesis protein CcmG/thiol:disulfide interchange protein DsbE
LPEQSPPADQPVDSDQTIYSNRSVNTDQTDQPPRLGTVRWVVLAVGVLAVALVVVLAVSERDRRGPPVPDFAPEFSGETLDGARFEMAAQRGRWVVVNFFSTWCVQCVVEHPELVAFHDRYSSDPNIRLVSVVFQDEVDVIARFFAAQGGDWPVVISNTGRIAIDFGVTAVPETYLVDPLGRVVSKFTGGVTLVGLEAELARAGA